MQKYPLDLTETELKVVFGALKYAQAYKDMEIYETVLNKLVEQLQKGTPRYYVVRGIVDDGICRSTRTVMVKAVNRIRAVEVAAMHLANEAGVVFQPTYVGEANKNYELCGVLKA